MKIILVTMLLLISTVTASWTGRSERVQTVTGKWVLKCEYRLPDKQTFWRLYDKLACPAWIEVE